MIEDVYVSSMVSFLETKENIILSRISKWLELGKK